MKSQMGSVNSFLLELCLSLVCLVGCASVEFPQCQRGFYVACDDLFRMSVQTRDFTLRYACASTLLGFAAPSQVRVRGIAARDCIDGYFADGTERERDFAALLLFLLGTEDSVRQVAPYYTEKLRDTRFTMKELSGACAYRGQWRELTIVGQDGEKKVVTLNARHALPMVVGLGAHAIPHLLALLSDDELETRASAYLALRDITQLDLPFFEDKMRLKAAAEALLREGGHSRTNDTVQHLGAEKAAAEMRAWLWSADLVAK